MELKTTKVFAIFASKCDKRRSTWTDNRQFIQFKFTANWLTIHSLQTWENWSMKNACIPMKITTIQRKIITITPKRAAHMKITKKNTAQGNTTHIRIRNRKNIRDTQDSRSSIRNMLDTQNTMDIIDVTTTFTLKVLWRWLRLDSSSLRNTDFVEASTWFIGLTASFIRNFF